MEFIPSRARNPYGLPCCLAVAAMFCCHLPKSHGFVQSGQPVAGLTPDSSKTIRHPETSTPRVEVEGPCGSSAFRPVTCYGVYSEQSEESLRSSMLPRGSCDVLLSFAQKSRIVQSGQPVAGLTPDSSKTIRHPETSTPRVEVEGPCGSSASVSPRCKPAVAGLRSAAFSLLLSLPIVNC